MEEIHSIRVCNLIMLKTTVSLELLFFWQVMWQKTTRDGCGSNSLLPGSLHLLKTKKEAKQSGKTILLLAIVEVFLNIFPVLQNCLFPDGWCSLHFFFLAKYLLTLHFVKMMYWKMAFFCCNILLISGAVFIYLFPNQVVYSATEKELTFDVKGKLTESRSENMVSCLPLHSSGNANISGRPKLIFWRSLT